MLTFGNLSYVRIKIDGEELPNTVLLNVVTVRSDTSLSLPSFSLEVRDTGKFLIDHVVEGAKVEILLAQKKENDSEWMPFRIFSFSHSHIDKFGTTYQIHGYYDAKPFLYSRVVRNFDGTSSSIVQTLAGEMSLETYLDKTSESNTSWYCARQTLANFMRSDVVPGATAGPQSLMMSVIDARTKSWCYKDIAKASTGKAVSKLINSSMVNEGEYDAMILQHKYGNQGGYNNVLGYSMKNSRYDVAKDKHTDDNEIKVAKSSSQLSMNKEIPENSYVLYAPLDFGNNGEGPKNRGVNIRQRSVWSMQIAILLSSYTPFPLLTAHQVDIFNGTEGADTRVSGKYVCTGRIITATPTNYREALVMIRNSEIVSNNGVVS
jgi:hypothetical protein